MFWTVVLVLLGAVVLAAAAGLVRDRALRRRRQTLLDGRNEARDRQMLNYYTHIRDTEGGGDG